ncbi:hypothetical protein JOF41_004386 [Saccharothrix coeruleofusca]|uniref:hypothetical protein n=1 Tax=Saccharothrix coeruleofusca TaxID=33919 RepID=UPI001AE9ABEE|nr:hypothetical protein [Saccharothrix coeruleofusca]MBP2338208.1 hypothetical protein [Saccharothrix coeruleofusca]
MLDESRRDDIGWLVATYDSLVQEAAGGTRDVDLAQVQRWLRRVTGLSSLSAAVEAARRLTRHEISFIAPVTLPVPNAPRKESVGRQQASERQERVQRRTPRPKQVSLPPPDAPRKKSIGRQQAAEPQERDQKRTSRPKPNRTRAVIAPPLNDDVAARLEKLFGQLDGLPQRTRTAAEEAEAERLRQQITKLTGLSRVETARKALRTFLTRRDGVRRFVPTKPYAEGSTRKPPYIKVVLGGSPGGGSRA